jgi:hypothetical protein
MKCKNGYIHPKKKGIKPNQECKSCPEKECMFRK